MTKRCDKKEYTVVQKIFFNIWEIVLAFDECFIILSFDSYQLGDGGTEMWD